MSPTTIRLESKQERRVAKVTKQFGSDRSKILKNALDHWLDAFDAAPDSEKAKMLLRPKTHAAR